MGRREFPPTGSPKVEGTAEDLDQFISSMNVEGNVFHLEKDLPTEELEKRKLRLEQLLAQFESASLAERTKLEAECPELLAIPMISPEAARYIESVREAESTDIKAGAENENYIFVDENGEKQVLKMSKGRHDYDTLSVIKLMRNMCALELFERHYRKFGSQYEGQVDIDMHFEYISVFKDSEGRYKRLIKQHFIEGEAVREKLEDEEVSDEFRQAWKKFLEQIGLLQVTAEVCLDITDYSQGASPSRGDVTRTHNFIIESPTTPASNYVFHVIDLDVFDDPLYDTLADKGRQHKFYATEQLRKRGSVLEAIKVFLVNMSRELYVKPWQDHYTKKELEK